MENNIYAQAGVSSEVFTSSGSSTLEASLINDTAFMMLLANKFSAYVTNLINHKFSNGNITFKYIILPITYHNASKYLDSSFKLVGSGYSFLIPALTLGIGQRDLGNLKDLENDLLKLDKKLIPLQTSYTQGADNNKSGRPGKEDSEKADTTLEKEESLDKNGGGS
jgi:hypothetical protein